MPVVKAGKALGWWVTVVDRRPGAANRREFAAADEVLIAPAQTACERVRPDARTTAVVMNHSFPDDRDAVAALLRSDCGYVGVLGPVPEPKSFSRRLPTSSPNPSAGSTRQLAST